MLHEVGKCWASLYDRLHNIVRFCKLVKILAEVNFISIMSELLGVAPPVCLCVHFCSLHIDDE